METRSTCVYMPSSSKMRWNQPDSADCFMILFYTKKKKNSGVLSSNKENKHVPAIRAESENRTKNCHSESSYS